MVINFAPPKYKIMSLISIAAIQINILFNNKLKLSLLILSPENILLINKLAILIKDIINILKKNK